MMKWQVQTGREAEKWTERDCLDAKTLSGAETGKRDSCIPRAFGSNLKLTHIASSQHKTTSSQWPLGHMLHANELPETRARNGSR